MDLRQLEYVVAVDEHGSFTKAARAMHVSQPSLSHGIRSLETELGVELFSRLGRAVAATAAGREVIDAARQVVRGVADLAVAAALVSSLTGLALPADCVYFGEISLSGAIRPVAHAQQRLKEAEKLGFGQAALPRGSEELGRNSGAFQPATLADLVVRIAGSLRREADD